MGICYIIVINLIMYTGMYVYMYVCMCMVRVRGVCVCVCMWKKERKIDRQQRKTDVY